MSRQTVLVVVPNWLGDAVMALPAIADVRRAMPDARLIVAARGGVADLCAMVPGVDAVLALPPSDITAAAARAQLATALTGWPPIPDDELKIPARNASSPRKNGDLEISRTSHACARFCIQVPMLEMQAPTNISRKSR